MAAPLIQKRIQTWREEEYTLVDDGSGRTNKSSAFRVRFTKFYPYAAISVAILVVITLMPFKSLLTGDVPASARTCKEPQLRREWRSLTTSERSDFYNAVNCLSTIPSQWGRNGTLYDDFTFLHGGIGSWCHRSASFLPWHRYTLSIWESSLRTHCGFKGQIPYWDWTLDWMNLTRSSIWDSITGFGGDGNSSLPVTVGGGRCVTDGPFSNLQPIMYNHTYIRHCLSRGFGDGEHLGQLSGDYYSPEYIGGILREGAYSEFVKKVEYYLHNTMHTAIGGDFLALTAANDPIFFVHHVQIDHLWWKWQQEKPNDRLQEYRGKHMFNSTGKASIHDILMYGGFTEDIPVSDVMNTEAGLLCYRY